MLCGADQLHICVMCNSVLNVELNNNYNTKIIILS